jgi:hypothetical protein
LTVSSNSRFVLNEQITGVSSGVTAYVTGFQGITLIGIDKASLSNFTTSEVITGNISGATTNVTTTNNNKTQGFWTLSGNSMWIGTNVSLSTSGLTDLYQSVTTTTPINVSNVTPSSGISASINSSGILNIQNTGVLSFNNQTGTVNGVSTVRGLTGTVGLTASSGVLLSTTGNTLTFTNTGVLSVNTATGDIINVAQTNAANIFTQSQQFTQGILIDTNPSSSNGGLTADFNKNTIYRPSLQFYNEPYAAITGVSGATLNLDLSIAQVFGVTLNNSIPSISISNATTLVPSRTIGFTLILTMGTSPATISSWGSAIKWPGGFAPLLSTGVGKTDVFSFVTYNNGISWLGFVGGQNYLP